MSLKRDDDSDFDLFGVDPFFDEDKDGKLSDEEQMYVDIFMDETTRDDPRDDDEERDEDPLDLFSSDERSDLTYTGRHYGSSGIRTSNSWTNYGSGTGQNTSSTNRSTSGYQYQETPYVAATNCINIVPKSPAMTERQYRDRRKTLKNDIFIEILWRSFLSIFLVFPFVAVFLIDATDNAAVFLTMVGVFAGIYFLGKLWAYGYIKITKSKNEIAKLDQEYLG